MTGPAWLGIGAQRSGTTWFSDLLLQHPQMALAKDGRKEVHFFDRFLTEEWSASETSRYRALFDEDRRSGDFTPAYMRSLWVPPLARQACGEGVLVLALLRDPVERFASALRWYATRPDIPGASSDRRLYLNWVRDKGNDALWGGMYATQLAAWAREFPRERIMVLQYEAVRDDPQAAADRVWKSLGLESRRLRATADPSWTTTIEMPPPEPWTSLPGLDRQLRGLYAPEIDALARDWGIDRELWKSASGRSARQA